MGGLFVNIRGKLLMNMKKIIFSLFMLFIVVSVCFKINSNLNINNLKGEMSKSAKELGFTDEKFYQCIIDNYNDNKGTNLTIYSNVPSDLDKITYLSCSGKKIEDVSGIKNLKELKTLDLYKNKITSINLNNNTKLEVANLGHNNIRKIDFSSLENINFNDNNGFELPTIIIKPYESYNILENIQGVNNINIESTDEYTYKDGVFINKENIQILSFDKDNIWVKNFCFTGTNESDHDNFIINDDNIDIFYYDDENLPNILESYRPMFSYKINDNILEIYDRKTNELIKSYNINGVKLKNAKIVGEHIISTINYTGNINDYIDFVSDKYRLDGYNVYDKNTNEQKYRLIDFISANISDYEIYDNMIYTGGEKFNKEKLKIINSRYDTDSHEIKEIDISNEVSISIANNSLKVYLGDLVFINIDYIEDRKRFKHNITINQLKNGSIKVSSDSALENEVINLTVIPDNNYELTYLSIEDENNNDITNLVNYDKDKNTFNMPDYNVIINAKFSEKAITNTQEKATKKTTYKNKISSTTKQVEKVKEEASTTKVIDKTNKVTSKINKVNKKDNSSYLTDIITIIIIFMSIILLAISFNKLLKEQNKG